MPRLIPVIICALSVLTALFDFRAAARPRSLDEALDSLDAALVARPAVVSARRARIDSMRVAPYGSERRRNLDIARAFCGLNTDSALQYYSAVLAAPAGRPDGVERNQVMVECARQMGVAAHYQDAFTYLDSVDTGQLDLYGRMSYHDVCSRVLLNAMNTAASQSRKDSYRSAARAQLDTLGELVGMYPGAQRMTRAVALAIDGDTIMAAGELYQAIDSLTPNTITFAIACDLLASYYRNRPDKRDDYLYFLALAAGSDAAVGNSEAYSLELLGSEVFKEGDFERALNYITVAGEAMQEGGIRHLANRGTPPMSIMLHTMRQREHNRHVAFIVTLSLLATVVLLFIVILARIMRRDKHTAARLSKIEARCDAKDRYISQLFELCAGYIDSIEEFNRLVGRKIKANQVKDLYDTVESGKILKSQTERFYENFDNAVLQIYPDFVNEINSLFIADRHIETPESGRLTPELRIAAFMRLGVVDSARIAKFLGLSLNTVYTYRNRMKSRAADRENFDMSLLKIG